MSTRPVACGAVRTEQLLAILEARLLVGGRRRYARAAAAMNQVMLRFGGQGGLQSPWLGECTQRKLGRYACDRNAENENARSGNRKPFHPLSPLNEPWSSVAQKVCDCRIWRSRSQ